MSSQGYLLTTGLIASFLRYFETVQIYDSSIGAWRMGFSICRSRLIFLAEKCLVATADSSYVDTIRVWNIAAEAYLTIPSNHSNDIDELVFESRNLTERGCFEA